MAVQQAAGSAPEAAPREVMRRTPACQPRSCDPGPLRPDDPARPAHPAEAIPVEGGRHTARLARAESATDPHRRSVPARLVTGPARPVLAAPMSWRTAIGGVEDGRGDAPPDGPGVPGR